MMIINVIANHNWYQYDLHCTILANIRSFIYYTASQQFIVIFLLLDHHIHDDGDDADDNTQQHHEDLNSINST